MALWFGLGTIFDVRLYIIIHDDHRASIKIDPLSPLAETGFIQLVRCRLRGEHHEHLQNLLQLLVPRLLDRCSQAFEESLHALPLSRVEPLCQLRRRRRALARDNERDHPRGSLKGSCSTTGEREPEFGDDARVLERAQCVRDDPGVYVAPDDSVW